MIIVLFGQPHSGKTTLATELSYHMFSKVIDGDLLRNMFSNKDYSKEGRLKNLNRASDIAHFLHLEEHENVILSLVYPYKEARDYLNSLHNDVKWVYLSYTKPRGREANHVIDFEEPNLENFLQLNTDYLTIEESIQKILKYVG